MNQEEMKFCQSCGMPLSATEDFGTEANGASSAEYCVYCYQHGAFTQNCSMEEMIQICVEFFDQFKDETGRTYTREEAIAGMREFFPHLKRWKK